MSAPDSSASGNVRVQGGGSQVVPGTGEAAFAQGGSTLPSGSSDFLNGRQLISIRKERENAISSPTRPQFVSAAGLQFATTNMEHWHEVGLDYIAKNLVLDIESLVDLEYVQEMMRAETTMPKLYLGITAVKLSGMYWFTGIANNRKYNPFLFVAVSMPELCYLSITFHTACFTTSRHSEWERIRLEQEGNLSKSKELKVKRLEDVVHHYGLGLIFEAKHLREVHVECIESDMVRVNCSWAGQNPLSVFQEIVDFIRDEFSKNASNPRVTTRISDGGASADLA